jgi:glyoxylase-like metal-dependent hydrolase (beta-lactamase superfamily II)
MVDIIRIDLNRVNCYLVKTEQGFILFDTGGHIVTDKRFTNRRDVLQDKLDAAGCTDSNLNLIILTHGDNDHVCNASYLKTRYKSPVAIHGDDRKLVENPTLMMLMDGFRYRSLAYRLIFGLLKNTIRKVTQKTLDDFNPFTPDILLSDGFDLSSYGLDAAVIHIPGHTKGSIAVLTKDGGLIAGDTFSNNKNPEEAANVMDFKQLSASVKKLKELPIKMVYPGHGTSFPFERI